MYSYHKYLKDKGKEEQHVREMAEYMKEALKHQVDKQQLAANYRSRIQKQMLQLTNKPVILNDYHHPAQNWKLRESQPDKMLKDPQIYIRSFKKQHERINQTLNYQYTDTTPTRSVSLHEFRPRDAKKQIQPGMKYTSKTGVERVEEFIKSTTLTQVDNEDFHFNKKRFEEQTRNLSLFEKRSYLSRELSKNLLPSLHHKTHYKGIEEISNRLKVAKSVQIIRKPSPGLNQSNPEFQSPRSQMNQTKRNVKPKIDPAEMSKKLLLTCHVTRDRSPQVQVLHKGQGRMFHEVHKE